MWNPIVSGSTDLWQHVWMYYSMPVEVREAGERTQDYRHKQQQSECMSFRKCKEQKYTDKNNICFFLPVSVVAHYATDWNLESIHRAELSRAEPSRAEPGRGFKLQLPKKKKSKMVSDPAGSRWSSAQQILLRLTQKVPTIYFYCCHVQSAPLRIGSPPPPSSPPSPSPSPSFTRSLRLFLPPPPTQRGPPWDVNRVVN